MLPIFALLTTLLKLSWAENYYVNPMICKATWVKENSLAQRPEINLNAGLKVISFIEIKGSYCELEYKSYITPLIGDSLNQNSISRFSIDIHGLWLGPALIKKENQVSVPFGIWANNKPIQLQIVSTSFSDGFQIDRLQGVDDSFADTEQLQYKLDCEAVVITNEMLSQKKDKHCE